MRLAQLRLREPARIRSLRFGDTTLTYVPDGAVQLVPRGWLPETTDADWAARPEYLDASGNLAGSLGGLLVERGPPLAADRRGLRPAVTEPSNATFVIDKLEKRQLIERCPHPTDRRARHLILTPQGSTLRDQLLELLTQDSPLAGLSLQEQGLLHDLLQRAIVRR